MRALFAALALLLAGCGDEAPSWSASFESGPADKTTVSVTAWRGSVRLRNSADGRIEVVVRGGAAPDPSRSWILASDDGRRVALVVPEEAKGRELEIEVAAPPGVSVSCACADADVHLSGAWARVEASTTGAITARVERLDSGKLESRDGAVVYSAAAGPTGELYVRARRDVSLHLPATWNGQVDCTTRGGSIDVPPHGSLQTFWDEDRTHVVGRVGPRGGDKALPTVWGSSDGGSVSLRLG